MKLKVIGYRIPKILYAPITSRNISLLSNIISIGVCSLQVEFKRFVNCLERNMERGFFE